MKGACSMEIRTQDDRWWAAAEARRFAAALGFSEDEQARIAVSVAELASNLAKHAGRGRITVTAINVPAPGVRVCAEDDGPGIAKPEQAVRDGFSEGRWLTPDVPAGERRGLGVGLGTVCRLMSAMRVTPRPGGGTSIEAMLYRYRAR
jgi:serine/threonine-protein kinase RsbT